MRPVFIYGLHDPATGRLRYLGQTVDPDVRLRDHIKNARKKKYHNANWIRSLLSKNLRPIMEILDVVPDNEADFWEREYIQNFLERGFDLTNDNEGGYGCRNTSLETRAKQRAGQLGRKHSLERRAATSAARKGTTQSAESNEKRRIAQSGEKNHFFGKAHKPETLVKLRAIGVAKIQQRQRDEKGRLI